MFQIDENRLEINLSYFLNLPASKDLSGDRYIQLPERAVFLDEMYGVCAPLLIEKLFDALEDISFVPKTSAVSFESSEHCKKNNYSFNDKSKIFDKFGCIRTIKKTISKNVCGTNPVVRCPNPNLLDISVFSYLKDCYSLKLSRTSEHTSYHNFYLSNEKSRKTEQLYLARSSKVLRFGNII